MGHHRATFARMAAAVATRTGAHQTRAVARVAMASPLRADFYRPEAGHTWAGRPVSKWCRWGYWEPDGSALNVTRII